LPGIDKDKSLQEPHKWRER